MGTAVVTGGTGFIGGEVCRLLCERGHRVVAFDVEPDEGRVEGLGVEVEVGDLASAQRVDAVIGGCRPEVVYHFGGMLSVASEADHQAAFEANARGTLNVLEAARTHRVRQVIYASTMVTYGQDIEGQTIDDTTLQRPNLFYGATKVFGEHLGLWYKRRAGLDFRGIRYPGIVGPGVKTPGVAQYNAWMIEAAIRGEPFSVWVREDTRHAILYYRDAARAAIDLADAPVENLKRAVYVITGPRPSPSAGELAAEVRKQIPAADIRFEVDEDKQRVLDDVERAIDDGNARREWGWEERYGVAEMVADMTAP